jgi:hypothetical protein
MSGPMPSGASRALLVALWRRADLCSSALSEAYRLAIRRTFGPRLGQLLTWSCELLDEMDEVLIALHPSRDPDAFAGVTALHRKLEEIQSLVPRERRSLLHQR